ncbi:MAG: hypothetical protein ABEI52_12560, partial [Halobacteriaceae archaeon]
MEFPNELAGQLSPNNVTVVSGQAEVTSSVQIVDGPDQDDPTDDKVEDTLKFQTNSDVGGSSDLVIKVNTAVVYPDNVQPGTQFGIDVWVEDSDGSDAYEENLVTVTVKDASASNTTTQTTRETTRSAD